ncbi:hypothetical protein ABB37_05083 [Leptomonas pyrrhocoris]|uniref:Uncharacterized protein n=1 Tax=Leptomonas pyrrhocoris TaxID=157538 RepID=A0A0M9G128_LEPPY|nr:hypothetical protein ABB37_05083 [Leptomonas pyrrhocoris]XP_015658513.1 hypothetical protein ABB37_05083 [Leptomonas pyrrhocoris]KPA80073.1 hypothetical protein ABB37_05083 [Leptomonas pyrrhocoris]KPA80074.1 hypothetical protein ABB37_05083 [Leptomonas pyrrhocoris]|eukprot:XP_015658512.1 hypothetical protein ABB37_05083 [Leptomonas pyrrhocoris]
MSVNQSAESTASSLQRSGLSITVGDTKSIVLALQALQSKIRSLEQDRDYHQDQYEVSLQAHEQQKLDMERQMEQERAAHRKREADLLELLRKARDERAELEDALSGNKEDLGGFRKELEEMIASEKELAEQRESKLNKEVARLREDIKDEQTRRAALLVTVDKLKEEREAALRTNEQLRVAMDDLLTHFEHQQQQQQQRLRHPSSSEPSQRTMSRGGPAGPSASMRGGASRGQVANGAVHAHRSARPRVAVNMQRHNYEDPTCSSMLRDVRVVPDEMPPCAYPSAQSPHDDDENGVADGHVHYRSARDSSRRGGEISPARRGVSAHSSHQRTSPAVIRTSSRPQNASARRAAPSSTAATGQKVPPPALSTKAMDEVEKQLRHELEELQHQYEDTVTRRPPGEIPSEVLAAALHRISSLIDQKKEQVKLLKEARRELEDAVGSAEASRSSGNGSGMVGEDKSTRRAMLVNELRSLLAEASS